MGQIKAKKNAWEKELHSSIDREVEDYRAAAKE